ncbi:MAG: transposase [Planctomycetota bacterium]
MKRKVKLTAIDGTGFESRHVSTYYAKRSGRPRENQHESCVGSPKRASFATARVTLSWRSFRAGGRARRQALSTRADGDPLRQKKYGQRWQVETVSSMIKRTLGSALRSRKIRNQHRETHLKAITHNVMLLREWLFY